MQQNMFDNAGSVAPKRKGSEAVAFAAHIQDFAMLNVDESPVMGNPGAAQHAPFHTSSDHRRAALWLSAEIKKAATTVTTQIVDLTPALANALMERNPNNRKISHTAVDTYARDMANGAWSFNGEPVIVSSDGLLNDGQHRCAAVILAGVPVKVVLVIGMERESRLTLDQGKNRMGADYLAMNGYIDSSVLAASGGFLWQYQNHGRISRQRQMRPTKAEVLAVITEHPGIVASVAAVPTKNSDIAGGRATLAFCHFVFSQKAGVDAASAFITSLTGGVGLMSRDPILYARNRLSSERGRLEPNEKAEMIFRAWNAHRRGETPKTLPILNGALPLLER